MIDTSAEEEKKADGADGNDCPFVEVEEYFDSDCSDDWIKESEFKRLTKVYKRFQ